MKLSISNIAWPKEHDEEMYLFLQQNNVSGLEIAPTRIFPHSPYDCIDEAKTFSTNLKNQYGLTISSLQSIWFGKTENIFASKEERELLIDYTKKTIHFAAAMDCKNIVFGCPKNRNMASASLLENMLIAQDFFATIAQYAKNHHTTIALEPNPPIYNTNFINTTAQAFDFCTLLKNSGLKVNVDLGTFIYNNENSALLQENVQLINHIHISEPLLAPIEKRDIHKQLYDLLRENYSGFFSIEMANPNNIAVLKEKILYTVNVLRY